jgi:hypothetical protein
MAASLAGRVACDLQNELRWGRLEKVLRTCRRKREEKTDRGQKSWRQYWRQFVDPRFTSSRW